MTFFRRSWWALAVAVPAGAGFLSGCALFGSPPEVRANDNRTAAGARHGDTLALQLVVQRARWHPEAPNGAHVDVEAVGEEGGAPQIPAPLIRVPTGTLVSATIRNALADSTIWVHGLFARPAEHDDSVAVAPGESRIVTFPVGAPGTYLYRIDAGRVNSDSLERETMVGALVVDSIGARSDDRTFVMNIWGEPIDSTRYRNVLAINGKSFPYTERVEATIGDTLRWRVVNGTIRDHPMHLHGFFYLISSRGSFRRDTVYDATHRRMAVTEVLKPFSTMAMAFTPDRDGHWLFHCHIAFHMIATDARLDPPAGAHRTMTDDIGQHMAGLVLGIDVKAPAGWTPPPRPSPRTLRLFVQEGPKRGRADRAMRYEVEHGTGEPPSDVVRVTGPNLVLTRNQPTDITVINRLKEPTAVHWHGLELESYSDGVAGWSGTADHLAPMIAPGDSFTARLTLPRAGTFIYHTHLNDYEQLTAGLYGAIVVVEPGDGFDSSRDHVYLAGWDGLEDPPHLVVNGDSLLAPVTWRAGRRHRFRFINIGLAGAVHATITRDSAAVQWRPVAKDGADLPPTQAVTESAHAVVDVGETADFELLATRGDYLLTLQRSPGRPAVVQRILVR